jgi:seryl-tRNA synthetase
MLTLKYIAENSEDVLKRLKKKHFDGKELISKVLELNAARRKKNSI